MREMQPRESLEITSPTTPTIIMTFKKLDGAVDKRTNKSSKAFADWQQHVQKEFRSCNKYHDCITHCLEIKLHEDDAENPKSYEASGFFFRKNEERYCTRTTRTKKYAVIRMS